MKRMVWVLGTASETAFGLTILKFLNPIFILMKPCQRNTFTRN